MKIKLFGLEREILSYDEALEMEPGDININVNPLSEQEYLSILFNNMGYPKHPKNLQALENPIETILDLEDNKLPVTRNKLVIKKTMLLFDLLEVIKNWIKTDNERGHILDPKNSLQLPSDEEINFNINNNLNIKRQYSFKEKLYYWSKSDFIWRRWYNLSPLLDNVYFEAAISDFYEASKYVYIKNGYIVFLSYLIDPDIFLSIVRNSEKEAYNNLKQVYSPAIMIHKDHYNTLLSEFQGILNRKIGYMKSLYEKEGINAFIINKPEEEINIILNNNITPYNYEVIKNIKIQIRETILDGDHKSYIEQYVDSNSLNELDNLDNELLRQYTYKKLYWFLMQIKSVFPELLNRHYKFIFSKPYFISDQVFGLYLPKEKNLFVTDENLNLLIMNLQEAKLFFKKYYNIDIILDSDEMKDSLESPIIEEKDLEILRRKEVKNDDWINIIFMSNNDDPDTIQNNGYELSSDDIVLA